MMSQKSSPKNERNDLHDLLEIIKRQILMGTEVICDCWGRYCGNLGDECYKRNAINHKLYIYKKKV